MSLPEHPVHEIEKELRELDEHLRVRCRRHTDLAVSRRPDELYAARAHVEAIRRLVKEIIPWERAQKAQEEARGLRISPFERARFVKVADDA
jgi:hypothetical protein